ncbi:MAG TPA: Gmad2 immunoglobulin-like domain-containing protein [Gaiellaceae bacterium]|nr:Gmad2 immunoglobulin-like domain-containing protein [Gaiellaceae bacterium]
MRFLALVASCLLALVLAGCGGDDESAGSPQVTQPSVPVDTEPQSDEEEREDEDPIIISVYFLRDGQVGLARRYAVEGEPRVGGVALKQLLGGPNAAERAAGLTTEIPAGTRLEQLSISDGVADAQFSRDLSPPATAQVVYTLTQFPTVRRVSVNGDRPLARTDLEELTPPIFVETPAPGDDVSSPVRITGTANMFEATFQVEVVDGNGKVVGKRFVTATSGSGMRGTFDAQVPFRVREKGPGKLLLFELSAEDGSRIHEVEIPLGLLPPATS